MAFFEKMMEGKNEMVKAPKTVIVCFCAVVALFVVAIVLSTCCVRQDVSDNGAGADAIRNELSTAGAELKEQASTITDAIGATQEARGATESILATERGDAELIGECRSILEAIRARAET